MRRRFYHAFRPDFSRGGRYSTRDEYVDFTMVELEQLQQGLITPAEFLSRCQLSFLTFAPLQYTDLRDLFDASHAHTSLPSDNDLTDLCQCNTPL